MRLEHHLVGGYVRYISPHIIIIISLDTICAIRFFSEPELCDSWDKHMVLMQTETISIFHYAKPQIL